MSPRTASRFPLFLVVIWTAALSAAVAGLAKYDNTAGKSSPETDWPKASRLERREGALQLVVFAHPACPCTPATLSELARAVGTASTKSHIHLVLSGPEADSIKWKAILTTLVKPGVVNASLVEDPDAKEAALFKARTSGQTFLFDAKGSLLFSGGITSSRGHEGSNTGEETVKDWLRGKSAKKTQTPVFGCPL